MSEHLCVFESEGDKKQGSIGGKGERERERESEGDSQREEERDHLCVFIAPTHRPHRCCITSNPVVLFYSSPFIPSSATFFWDARSLADWCEGGSWIQGAPWIRILQTVALIFNSAPCRADPRAAPVR